jgi:hypothetical protein
VELSQLEPGESVEQSGEERPVGRGEAGFVNLTLQDDELVAQRQDLDVLVGVAHRQQPYEGEHARERQVGQSQQHDASSWRTPSRGLQPYPRTGRSQPMDGVFGTYNVACSCLTAGS